jgi:hypothetical protein
MKKLKYLSLAVVLLFAVSGCYYDNVEELHPGTNDSACADTAATDTIRYAKVAAIISVNCGSSNSACHNSTNTTPLTNYAEVVAAVEDPDKTFMLDITHDPLANYEMPKGGGKLSDCQIIVIQHWIDQGKLEN